MPYSILRPRRVGKTKRRRSISISNELASFMVDMRPLNSQTPLIPTHRMSRSAFIFPYLTYSYTDLLIFYPVGEGRNNNIHLLPHSKTSPILPAMADWSSLPSELVRRIADCLLDTNDLDCYMDFRASDPTPQSSPKVVLWS